MDNVKLLIANSHQDEFPLRIIMVQDTGQELKRLSVTFASMIVLDKFNFTSPDDGRIHTLLGCEVAVMCDRSNLLACSETHASKEWQKIWNVLQVRGLKAEGYRRLKYESRLEAFFEVDETGDKVNGAYPVESGENLVIGPDAVVYCKGLKVRTPQATDEGVKVTR